MSAAPDVQRATLLLDAKCELGEGATWCAQSGRLYWTDIEGAQLWRYDPATGRSESFGMPERLATFALCANPRYVLVGLASHLAFFDLESGTTQRIVDVEADLNTRLNDGRCDRQGRFVFGTKDESGTLQRVAGFYRLNRDLSLERLPLPAPAISNSIAFSPDGATMYYCDSPTREIRACDYRADGSIANDRVFTRLTDAHGLPDGSSVDSEGGLWNAQWGGARVVRYGPDGVETERVEVPATQPTCVALGGSALGQAGGQAALDTLYITSAYAELDAAARAADAFAGGVFVATLAWLGVPEPLFQGSPA
ncbi:SMP-30/gluconolactonase/LRE family protein [Burkholderia sp. Ax-1724]|uniref:SMP-30/gluconolactonase/LRE family protein n=1 Tax=Burkholderia sp. Ax-1724 TaxID=2608336 RepID=UPI001420C59F|nr:SMP-30/gluconolactonase/LRE family protein [Burkholderia sp. Ax-1724]NIF55804.1 SMP-30/gluconolactonase/LRE family protein [Burkholderia sp. Ax-1724]